VGFGPEQLRDKALLALEEAARQSREAPVTRSRALGFALAYLWAYGGGDREMFLWFWRSLTDANAIGRSQNVNASLNGIYRAVGARRE
jgi:hypothetical protein